MKRTLALCGKETAPNRSTVTATISQALVKEAEMKANCQKVCAKVCLAVKELSPSQSGGRSKINSLRPKNLRWHGNNKFNLPEKAGAVPLGVETHHFIYNTNLQKFCMNSNIFDKYLLNSLCN